MSSFNKPNPAGVKGPVGLLSAYSIARSQGFPVGSCPRKFDRVFSATCCCYPTLYMLNG